MSELDRGEQIELLLDHYNSPRNYGEMEGADVSVQGGNPGCGDIITLYVKMNGDRVEAITFTGEGCTISQAATSMLTEEMSGATLAEIEAMDFHTIEEMIGSEMVHTRPKCATLGLDTLKKVVMVYRGNEIRKRLGES